MTTIFDFEKDFAGTLRCIPMAVRLKLDDAGIKLSLRQWSQFTEPDRRLLLETKLSALRPLLLDLIAQRTTEPAREIPEDPNPAWRDSSKVPEAVQTFARSQNLQPPTQQQWSQLSELQRFTLLKLTRPGHDNENFVPAMKEFKVVT